MSPVLERDAECDRFAGWIDDVRASRGRVVFVGGEAGIGKTTLVAAVIERAARQGVRSVVGHCDALVTARTLGPFRDILGRLGIDAVHERDPVLAALADDLRTSGPTLVVVEDAHWADDSSAELVALLGRRALELPVLLVVTYREHELAGQPRMRQVIGDLAPSAGTSFVSLQPLSPAAVGVLAAGQGWELDELHRLTGGNPFYVTEVLAADRGLPTSVRLAVLARAARLPANARRVLDAVAVSPGGAEPWFVEALTAESADGLARCQLAGVLVADERGVTFRHELARRVVEEEIAHDRRVDLHRAAVASLTAHAADPARVAHHAALAGLVDAAARADAEACALALRSAAFGSAARHGERALASPNALSGDDRADVQLAVAQAYAALGRWPDAVKASQAVADHWRSVGDGVREASALSASASALISLGDTVGGVAAVTQSIDLLAGVEGPALASAYTLMTSIHMLARDRERAVEWGERARDLATRVGDHRALATALVQLGAAEMMAGSADGPALVREGMAVARRHDLAAVVALGYSQLGSGGGELRRYDLALPALEEGIRWSAAHALEGSRHYALAWLARCRFDGGAWAEAEGLARDVLVGTGHQGIAGFVALTTLGWIRARRGDDDPWTPLDDALAIARQTGHLQRLWPVAVARLEAGLLAGAPSPHVELALEAGAMAERYGHGVAAGELAWWLGRAGIAPPGALVALSAAPFRDALVSADRGAAAFAALRMPYEEALAWVDRADPADPVEAHRALRRLDELGAAPQRAAVAARFGLSESTTSEPLVTGQGPGGSLSTREREVLRLVAAGFTNPQIAASLYISRKTAEHHVSNILTKLGAVTRTEAAMLGLRLGIIER